MSVFVTSDLHFNHRNILKYCVARRRGKETPVEESEIDSMVHEMNELIISNWNSLVRQNDEVWILGDVAMGQIFKAPALISRLNGKKHLIKGNHDKTLVKLKTEQGNFLAVNSLFESIQDYKEISFTYNNKKHFICMSHYPMASWNGMNQNSIHLHGHLHGDPSGLTGRIMDVGMDTNNLYPYLFDSVVEEMLKIEIIRDHHVQ